MCGLFGWITDGSIAREQMAATACSLAIYNDTRGGDSWGMFNDASGVVRGLGKFAASVKATEVLNARMMLGHTRLATTGKVKIENSHPFEAGRIIGAHNGMVANHWELNREFDRACRVDSEHIFRHLNEGLKLQDIEAYGAVTWVDTDENVLQLGRFNGGELSAVAVPGGVFWSSSAEHLRAAINAAALRVQMIFKLKEGQAYLITPRGIKKTRKLPISKARWGYYAEGGWDGHYGGWCGSRSEDTHSYHGKDGGKFVTKGAQQWTMADKLALESLRAERAQENGKLLTAAGPKDGSEENTDEHAQIYFCIECLADLPSADAECPDENCRAKQTAARARRPSTLNCRECGEMLCDCGLKEGYGG